MDSVFPLRDGFFGQCKYPIYEKISLLSLQPASLTSCTYKSRIIIIYSTVFFASFIVGIEKKGAFSAIGRAASPNCHCDGVQARGTEAFVTSAGPSHFGYPLELLLCCPNLPGRVSHCEEDSKEIITKGSASMYLIIHHRSVEAGTASAAVTSSLSDPPHREIP